MAVNLIKLQTEITMFNSSTSSWIQDLTFLHADLDTFSDCMKSDPELSEETEKSFTELLSEEVKLREIQALENQRRADRALLEAKKVASQYQKEADKCNMGMETCEEAREKAEAALETQRKLSAMWEIRARQRGWRDSLVRPRVYWFLITTIIFLEKETMWSSDIWKVISWFWRISHLEDYSFPIRDFSN